ncbi:hypothetical protein EDD11_002944 [Mortierella claussenii]|nr:hypothetical protein EDD11_002944 [Mortierella claussenii]
MSASEGKSSTGKKDLLDLYGETDELLDYGEDSYDLDAVDIPDAELEAIDNYNEFNFGLEDDLGLGLDTIVNDNDVISKSKGGSEGQNAAAAAAAGTDRKDGVQAQQASSDSSHSDYINAHSNKNSSSNSNNGNNDTSRPISTSSAANGSNTQVEHGRQSSSSSFSSSQKNFNNGNNQGLNSNGHSRQQYNHGNTSHSSMRGGGAASVGRGGPGGMRGRGGNGYMNMSRGGFQGSPSMGPHSGMVGMGMGMGMNGMAVNPAMAQNMNLGVGMGMGMGMGMNMNMGMGMGMNNGPFPGGFGNQGMNIPYGGGPQGVGGMSMPRPGMGAGRTIHINPNFQNRTGVLPNIPGAGGGPINRVQQQHHQRSTFDDSSNSNRGSSRSRESINHNAGSSPGGTPRDGRDGRDGRNGRDGRDGRDGDRYGRNQGYSVSCLAQALEFTKKSSVETCTYTRLFSSSHYQARDDRSSSSGSGVGMDRRDRLDRGDRGPVESYNPGLMSDRDRDSPRPSSSSSQLDDTRRNSYSQSSDSCLSGSLSSRLGLKRSGDGTAEDTNKAHKSSGESTPRGEQSRSENATPATDTGSVSFLRDRRAPIESSSREIDARLGSAREDDAMPKGFVKMENVPESMSDASIRKLADGVSGVNRVLTLNKKGDRIVTLGFGSMEEAKFFRRQINRTTIEGALVTVTLASSS